MNWVSREFAVNIKRDWRHTEVKIKCGLFTLSPSSQPTFIISGLLEYQTTKNVLSVSPLASILLKTDKTFLVAWYFYKYSKKMKEVQWRKLINAITFRVISLIGFSLYEVLHLCMYSVYDKFHEYTQKFSINMGSNELFWCLEKF